MQEGLPQEAVAQKRAVEMQRIEDNIIVKYGFTQHHLARCVEYYQLGNNPEIGEYRNQLIKEN